MYSHYFLTDTSEKLSPPTFPPRIEDRTFWANFDRFSRRSRAASARREWREPRKTVSSSVVEEGCSKPCSMGSTGTGEVLTLVEGVVGVGLEEQVLKSDHDSVQVQDWLPILAQNVEAHVALEVEVGVIDLRAEEVRSAGGSCEWRRSGLGRSSTEWDSPLGYT